MFHHWISTGEEVDNGVVVTPEGTEIVEVSCLGCGVVTAEWVEGVVVDHATLPLTCPGQVENPHHFHALSSVVGGIHNEIECGWCDVIIADTTLPSEVVWECPVSRDS